MLIKTAKFVISNTELSLCPAPKMPEYAFIGRSNVGKSSLINMLTNHKSLAKTSGRPGKTKLINHFIINEEWYLVDLPGYGYARVSKGDRKKWSKFINTYLQQRTNLICVFVLLDSRLEPQPIDVEFMSFLGTNQIPFAMVFTKLDKLSKRQRIDNLKRYKDKMLESWEELPQIFSTSATDATGKEELLEYIQEVNATLPEFK